MKKVLKIKILVASMLLFIATMLVLFLKTNSRELKVVSLSPTPKYREKTVGQKSNVIIYEFSDFSCPACQKMHFYVKELVAYFPDVKVSFKHYPLTTIHPNAFKAALWAECAGKEYGKFWEFADLLFSLREKWSNSSEPLQYFEDFSKKLSLDISVMKRCVSDSNAVDLVKADMNEGDRIGVDSTPTFFVNGKKAVGGVELVERLKEVIK